MKKILSFIVVIIIAQAVAAQTITHVKLRPESGWRLDSNGNLPTITFTVNGTTYTGTPTSQDTGINFVGIFPVPIIDYHITDNEYRHYLMSPYTLNNAMIGLYFVTCLD